MRSLLMLIAFCASAQLALAESRCSESSNWWGRTTIQCSHETVSVKVAEDDVRDVLYQTPSGQPPIGGWPVAFIYQGSYFDVSFEGQSGTAFGGFYQILLIKTLLDNGFAVIAPSAGPKNYWDTNNVSGDYQDTADYAYLSELFDRVASGDFGPLNADRMYATGISSGGYNTSRMALDFPGQFRALAIQSASYATCAGVFCSVPDALPSDHPPTLFLHGTRDLIVPAYTMRKYYRLLRERGITRSVTDSVGHEWLPAAPDEILNWFLMHP